MNFFLLSLLLTLCAAHGANNLGNDNTVDDAPVPHNPYETVTEMLAKLAAKATDADLERLTTTLSGQEGELAATAGGDHRLQCEHARTAGTVQTLQRRKQQESDQTGDEEGNTANTKPPALVSDMDQLGSIVQLMRKGDDQLKEAACEAAHAWYQDAWVAARKGNFTDVVAVIDWKVRVTCKDEDETTPTPTMIDRVV